MSKILREYKYILRPTFMSIGISLSTLFFSLLTNKIIAIYASLSGFAIFTIVKSVHQVINSINKLGRENIIINASSKSKTIDERTFILAKTFFIFSIQSILSFAIFIFFSLIFFELLFNGLEVNNKLAFLLLIFFLSICISLYEQILAFLNGQLMLKAILVISLLSALGVTLAAFILKPTNYIEITIIALLSGLLGLTLSIFFLRDILSFDRLNLQFARLNLKSVYEDISFSMMLQPLIAALSYFVCQLIYLNKFGANSLPIFSSSYVLYIMIMTVFMSSARFFLQPSLASAGNRTNERGLLLQYIYIYLIATSILTVLLMLASNQVLVLVFSQDFIIARNFFKVLVYAIPIAVLNWILAIHFISREKYNTYALIEAFKDLLLIISFISLIYYLKDMYLSAYAFLTVSLIQGLILGFKAIKLEGGLSIMEISKLYCVAISISGLLIFIS